jgi:hypothetical protein
MFVKEPAILISSLHDLGRAFVGFVMWEYYVTDETGRLSPPMLGEFREA